MKPPPAWARNSPEQGAGAARSSVRTWQVSDQTRLGDERTPKEQSEAPSFREGRMSLISSPAFYAPNLENVNGNGYDEAENTKEIHGGG